MEEKLRVEMEKCTGFASFSEQYGQNMLVLPTGNNWPPAKADRVSYAIETWISPLTYYGLKNISDYDNNRLYTFANMANGRTLRFGCGYKECAVAGGDPKAHISCIYNIM
ncbi:hypothetical protein ANCDUO_11447 [Ancylostoma duodenale]|uniref:SCP domain-containing protein n=1 Tax=Ancylostoma duodenale TaxID=51022 RepID=A0A0C2D862_9BILA|nr:hypothetical protein ANCDUO_11447 [Ancylostoma duodenale]